MADTISTSLPNEVISKPSTSAPLSPLRVGARRFRRHRMAMFGLGLLILIAFYITLGVLASRGYCTPLKKDVSG